MSGSLMKTGMASQCHGRQFVVPVKVYADSTIEIGIINVFADYSLITYAPAVS